MARKKKKVDVEEFANEAYRRGSTYAKAQVAETLTLVPPIVVPEGYTRVGDRMKKEK